MSLSIRQRRVRKGAPWFFLACGICAFRRGRLQSPSHRRQYVHWASRQEESRMVNCNERTGAVGNALQDQTSQSRSLAVDRRSRGFSDALLFPRGNPFLARGRRRSCRSRRPSPGNFHFAPGRQPSRTLLDEGACRKDCRRKTCVAYRTKRDAPSPSASLTIHSTPPFLMPTTG